MSDASSARLFLVLATVAAIVLGPAATVSAEPRTERVLVGLRQDVAVAAGVAGDLAARHGGRVHGVFNHAVRGAALEVPATAVAALSRDPRVAWVEPDHPVEIAGEIPTGVARVAAVMPDAFPTDPLDADIAILDTGVDASHPDLHVAGGVDCTSGTCLPVDLPVDPHGHGTHVAGSAAALPDGRGVVGTAPGARLWSVRVLDETGSGRLSHIVAGIDWVTANTATIEVANASLSCACTSTTMDAAIDRATEAGVVVVAAAGNDGEDAAGHSPAHHPSVITVSAIVDHDGEPGGLASGGCSAAADDTFASFSNFGEVVDLAAPGVCILSTVPGGYARASGTSMAAPHVAGAAVRYVVEHTIARDGARAGTVRGGLVNDWSVAQSSACGFTGGRSAEPLLLLEACAADEPVTDAPAQDPTKEPTEEPTAEEPADEPTQEPTTEEPTPTPSEGPDRTPTEEPTPTPSDEPDRTPTGEPTPTPTEKPTSEAPAQAPTAPSELVVERVAGTSRIGTSVAISRDGFPSGAPAAVVASADAFPDALAAAPLAAAAGGPVLLNDRDGLNPQVAVELERLRARTVYLMGGTSAQGSAVERAIRAAGTTVVRLAGPDRFATAGAAADQARKLGGTDASTGVVVALGVDFPDALAGGTLAAARRQPLLLTARDQLPASTRETLERLGATTATIVGGEFAVGRDVVEALTAAGLEVDRIAGTSRYDTAVRAAAAAVEAGASYDSVVLASGRSFPDALSAAPVVAAREGVLLMSEPDVLPDETRTALTLAPVRSIMLAGGSAALTDRVLDAALDAATENAERSP